MFLIQPSSLITNWKKKSVVIGGGVLLKSPLGGFYFLPLFTKVVPDAQAPMPMMVGMVGGTSSVPPRDRAQTPRSLASAGATGDGAGGSRPSSSCFSRAELSLSLTTWKPGSDPPSSRLRSGHRIHDYGRRRSRRGETLGGPMPSCRRGCSPSITLCPWLPERYPFPQILLALEPPRCNGKHQHRFAHSAASKQHQ
jgi:hypothetical protein